MAKSSVVSILLQVKTLGQAAFGKVAASLRGIRDQIFSLRTAVAAMAAFVVARIGRDLVGAFAEQEAAIVRLNAALRVTGRFTEEGSRRIQDMAGEMQRLTTISDETALSVSATVAQLARELTPDQLAQVQQAAIGLAQALGTDVLGAAVQLGKTLSGEMNALGRLGIQIDTTASQQDRFNEIMQKTAPLFRIAVEATSSLQGQFAQAKNQIGELQETFGQLFLAIVGVEGGNLRLAEQIARTNENLRENLGTWVKWGRVVLGLLHALWKSVTATLKVIVNAGVIAGNVLLLAITGVQMKFVDLQNKIIQSWNRFLLSLPEPMHRFLGISRLMLEEIPNIAAEEFDEAKTDIVIAATEINLALGEAERAWKSFTKATREQPRPPAAFDIGGRGGGPNLGPPSGADPVAASKQLAQQAKVLQQQLETNQISAAEFREELEKLGPAMARVQTQLTGDDLVQFSGSVDELRKTARELGLTFNEAGVQGVTFAAAFRESARQAERSVGTLNDKLAELTMGAIMDFAGAITDAFAAVVDGSKSAGEAFASAMLSAIAKVAAGLAQFYAIKAGAALGEGFLGNPAAFASAAKFGAAAAGFAALAGILGGAAAAIAGGSGTTGGGGGPAAVADQRFDDVREERGDLTLVVEGWHPDDTKVIDTLAEILAAADGRNVIIRRQGA